MKLKNKILNSGENSHIWKFSIVGGVNRVNLETGMDLLMLENLDQKLWTALSCPVHGLEIDSKTLELIDTDKDGRIRVPEILKAVKWITSIIKDPGDLIKENKSLLLSAINDNIEEGQNLLKSARQILLNLDKPDKTFITVDETSDTEKIFANTKFNGDGIITNNSTDNEDIKNIIGNIIACIGSAKDRNGYEGISGDHINIFFKNCEEYSNWYIKAESDLNKFFPFGDQTPVAYTAFSKIKPKIEDYFLRCHLAKYDPDSTCVLNSYTEKFQEISSKNLTSCINELIEFPLAKIDATQQLLITKGINPAWEKSLADFVKFVIKPEFPDKVYLTEADFEEIKIKFDQYLNWQSEKAGIAVEKLGLNYIREVINSNSKEFLISLINQDKSLEKDADNIFLVDKLVRYYRDIFTLLKNFVTFYDFYSPDKKAIFQAGSLYIDQRCCELCIKVNDLNKHNKIAGSCGMCLIYCDCFSKLNNETMTIVAALTDGNIDNISIGRNAIFYDRKGNDWDATIVKVIDNPISIRQAFWSPYRKVSKFISNQVEKFASAKEKESESKLTVHAEKTATKIETVVTEPAKSTHQSPPFDIGKFVGIFAAISLALGAIGSVIASILTGFFKLTWWKIPFAIIGIILSISGPSMILAWLKLRKRNLAPLLDANGWAINAKASVNIKFGKTLTQIASLPINSKLNLVDPFSKKKNPLIYILIVLILIICLIVFYLWHFGILKKWCIF